MTLTKNHVVHISSDVGIRQTITIPFETKEHAKDFSRGFNSASRQKINAINERRSEGYFVDDPSSPTDQYMSRGAVFYNHWVRFALMHNISFLKPYAYCVYNGAASFESECNPPDEILPKCS